MTWLEKVVNIVRTLINDLDSVDYSDARIQQVVMVAAFTMTYEICFSQTYTIDMEAQTIEPEPNQDFITLLSLKTAMLIYNGESKAAAKNSFSIQDGPSTINTTGSAKSSQDNLKNIKAMYDDAKLRYCMNGSVGKVVMTPTTYDGNDCQRTNL